MIESFVLSTSSKTQLKQQNGFFPLRNGLQIPSERGKGPGFLEIASFYTVCYSEVMLEQD